MSCFSSRARNAPISKVLVPSAGWDGKWGWTVWRELLGGGRRRWFSRKQVRWKLCICYLGNEGNTGFSVLAVSQTVWTWTLSCCSDINLVHSRFYSRNSEFLSGSYLTYSVSASVGMNEWLNACLTVADVPCLTVSKSYFRMWSCAIIKTEFYVHYNSSQLISETFCHYTFLFCYFSSVFFPSSNNWLPLVDGCH